MDLNKVNIEKLPADVRKTFKQMQLLLAEKKIQNKAKNDFLSFVKCVWPDFVEGSHHRHIADKFNKLASGEINRLIINMPPRHTKSEFASYLLPAWMVGRDPKLKIIQATHTAELAIRFGRKAKNLIDSEDYSKIFKTRLQEDSKAAGRWETAQGGEYFAAGVGGAITGRGADLLIIDDLKKTGKNEPVYTLLECHVNLDLEGFEEVGADGQPTGIKLPYIVTVEEGSRLVLSIRRNYAPNDLKKNKIQYFVHFKFLPGLGFYGFGLIHMIGGLSRTATAALRQLLDAGTLSNLPAGFKQRGVRVRDEAAPIQPGEFKDVDAPGGNLRDAFFPLPYKEPSQTLLNLLGIVVQAGQRFAAIADMQVGDGNQAAAVGTTIALLERGSRVMSAIHKRCYAAMKKEFKLLSKVVSQYLPPEYPYDVVGGARNVKQADFDDRIDVIPVADPNIFSMSQRITLAQTQLQIATSNPQLHNMYQIYRNMYEAIGVKNVDAVLPPPAPTAPMDPSMEHINALAGKPFQAFPGQDHRAHITAHLNFMSTNIVRNNPAVMAAIQKNILEHISLMAQEQVQLEFREQMQQMMMMQQQAAMNPQMQQQLQALTNQVEARKSVLIAEMTEEFMKEEKKITSQFDNDPLLKLKSREVDLRAMENERKKDNDEAQIDLARARLMQQGEIAEDKMEQNEDLAKLRAGVSLAKTGVQQAAIVTEDN